MTKKENERRKTEDQGNPEQLGNHSRGEHWVLAGQSLPIHK